MSAWRKEPPTHEEWIEAKNHGYWWVKFLLMEEEIDVDEDGNLGRWPEAWYTEVVQLTASYENAMDMLDPDKPGKLHAEGNLILGRFDLDDKDKLKNMYWQPVLPPFNDEKDKRPDVV